MWYYEQLTGSIFHNAADKPLATGYSGHGDHVNLPESQDLKDLGPIPRGLWTIADEPYDSVKHGPYVLRLTPDPETKLFGRGGFLMHGDSREHPGEASEGCIIQYFSARQAIHASGDRRLTVVRDSVERLSLTSQSSGGTVTS